MTYLDELKKKLRVFLQKNVDTNFNEIMKELNTTHSETLELIHNIQQEYTVYAKKNALKFATATSDITLNNYFQNSIVDLGFLCQHHIKEINNAMGNKLNTSAHRMFHDSWILHRGY